MNDWDPDIDSDGYPSDEALAAIQVHLSLEIDSKTLTSRFLKAIESFAEQCWCAEAGWVDVDVRGELKRCLGFHTCGWSGSEDFIIEMKRASMGIPWALLFQRMDGGGHYYFSED